MEVLVSNKDHNVILDERVKEDLVFAKKFLDIANSGVSVNLLTF